jgi:hypothetical protein
MARSPKTRNLAHARLMTRLLAPMAHVNLAAALSKTTSATLAVKLRPSRTTNVPNVLEARSKTTSANVMLLSHSVCHFTLASTLLIVFKVDNHCYECTNGDVDNNGRCQCKTGFIPDDSTHGCKPLCENGKYQFNVSLFPAVAFKTHAASGWRVRCLLGNSFRRQEIVPVP